MATKTETVIIQACDVYGREVSRRAPTTQSGRPVSEPDPEGFTIPGFANFSDKRLQVVVMDPQLDTKHGDECTHNPMDLCDPCIGQVANILLQYVNNRKK